jgi:small subunit ribosomal protein S4
VNIPSYHLVPGREIAVREKSRNSKAILAALDLNAGHALPSWLEFDRAAMRAKVLSIPRRDDVSFPIQEQMIVELYSK